MTTSVEIGSGAAGVRWVLRSGSVRSMAAHIGGGLLCDMPGEKFLECAQHGFLIIRSWRSTKTQGTAASTRAQGPRPGDRLPMDATLLLPNHRSCPQRT